MTNRRNTYRMKYEEHTTLSNNYKERINNQKYSKFMFWRTKIKHSNSGMVVKKFPIIKFSIIVVFIVVSILAISSISLKTNKFIGDIFQEIGYIFDAQTDDPTKFPGESLIQVSWELLLKTMEYTVIGTAIGFFLSLPTALLSARNINKIKWLNKIARLFMLVIRSFPPLIFAFFFSLGFSPALAATLTLTLFTWGTLNKLFYEEIESVNMESYNSMLSTGASPFMAFKETIFKEISSKFLSLILYQFELNLRFSTILGVIGIISIGTLVNDYGTTGQWWFLGVPLAFIVGSVILLEAISSLMRIFVFEKNRKPYSVEELHVANAKKKYLVRKIIAKYQKQLNKATITNEINNINNQKEKELNALETRFLPVNLNEIIENEKKKEDKRFKKVIEKISRVEKKVEAKKTHKAIIKLKQIKFEAYEEHKRNLKIINSYAEASIDSNYVYETKPKSWIFTYSSIVILIGILVASLVMMVPEFQVFNISNMNDGFSGLFSPDTETLFGNKPMSAFPLLSKTLAQTLFATLLGGIMAIIIGALASRRVLGKYASLPFQALIILIRSLPAFLVALMLIPLMNDPMGAGVFALSIHSVGMLGKLVREQFNAMNNNVIVSLRSSGMNSWEVFKLGMVPQVAPNILSVLIYRFEINLKSTIALGAIGASDYGQALTTSFNNNSYNIVGALVWSLIILVVIVEMVSNTMRSYIISGVAPLWYVKATRYINRRLAFKRASYLKAIGYKIQKNSDIEINGYYLLEKEAVKNIKMIKMMNETDAINKIFIKEDEFNKLYINQLINKIYSKDEWKQITKKHKEEIKKLKLQYKEELKGYKDLDKSSEMKKLIHESNQKFHEFNKDYKQAIANTKSKLHKAKHEIKKQLHIARSEHRQDKVDKAKLELRAFKKSKRITLGMIKNKPVGEIAFSY